MSNSLYPDQDLCSVYPDLGPNCLQRLLADNKSRLARKEIRDLKIIPFKSDSEVKYRQQTKISITVLQGYVENAVMWACGRVLQMQFHVPATHCPHNHIAWY